MGGEGTQAKAGSGQAVERTQAQAQKPKGGFTTVLASKGWLILSASGWLIIDSKTHREQARVVVVIAGRQRARLGHHASPSSRLAPPGLLPASGNPASPPLPLLPSWEGQARATGGRPSPFKGPSRPHRTRAPAAAGGGGVVVGALPAAPCGVQARASCEERERLPHLAPRALAGGGPGRPLAPQPVALQQEQRVRAGPCSRHG
jgi:hypothetical protein